MKLETLFFPGIPHWRFYLWVFIIIAVTGATAYFCLGSDLRPWLKGGIIGAELFFMLMFVFFGFLIQTGYEDPQNPNNPWQLLGMVFLFSIMAGVGGFIGGAIVGLIIGLF